MPTNQTATLAQVPNPWVVLTLRPAFEPKDSHIPTHRPLSSSLFMGLYVEPYKVVPTRNYLGAYGWTCCNVDQRPLGLDLSQGRMTAPLDVRKKCFQAFFCFLIWGAFGMDRYTRMESPVGPCFKIPKL